MKFHPVSQLDSWCCRLHSIIISSDENSWNNITSLLIPTVLFLQIRTHIITSSWCLAPRNSNVSTWITNSPAALTVYSLSMVDQIFFITLYSKSNKGIQVRESSLSKSSSGFPDTSSVTLSKYFCSAFVHTFLFWPGRWRVGWKGMTGGDMPKQWK